MLKEHSFLGQIIKLDKDHENEIKRFKLESIKNIIIMTDTLVIQLKC